MGEYDIQPGVYEFDGNAYYVLCVGTDGIGDKYVIGTRLWFCDDPVFVWPIASFLSLYNCGDMRHAFTSGSRDE